MCFVLVPTHVFLQFHVHVLLKVDDNKQCDETETIVDYYLYNVLGSYEYIVDYGEETVVDSL